VHATVHPNVPTFLVAQRARHLLDFMAGWHCGVLSVRSMTLTPEQRRLSTLGRAFRAAGEVAHFGKSSMVG
jgi:hypothetical protein